MTSARTDPPVIQSDWMWFLLFAVVFLRTVCLLSQVSLSIKVYFEPGRHAWVCLYGSALWLAERFDSWSGKRWGWASFPQMVYYSVIHATTFCHIFKNKFKKLTHFLLIEHMYPPSPRLPPSCNNSIIKIAFTTCNSVRCTNQHRYFTFWSQTFAPNPV